MNSRTKKGDSRAKLGSTLLGLMVAVLLLWSLQASGEGESDKSATPSRAVVRTSQKEKESCDFTIRRAGGDSVLPASKGVFREARAPFSGSLSFRYELSVVCEKGKEIPHSAISRRGPFLIGTSKERVAVQGEVKVGGFSQRNKADSRWHAVVPIDVTGLESTGKVGFELEIDRRDGTTPVLVSPQIHIKDEFWLPLLTIVSGVVFAGVVRYFGQLGPEEKNRQRFARIKARLAKRGAGPGGDVEGRIARIERINAQTLGPLAITAELSAVEREVAQLPGGGVPDPDRVDTCVRNRELVYVGLAMCVACLTALHSSYLGEGKLFGGASDYVGAFLWGSGSDLVTRGLGKAFEALSPKT